MGSFINPSCPWTTSPGIDLGDEVLDHALPFFSRAKESTSGVDLEVGNMK
jgi:hypothetical protein